jgi:restriction system protein
VRGIADDIAGRQLVLDLTTDILASVRLDPSRLWQISDRAFEELIAEIFARQGYRVELTKRTRDNGYDILAVQNNLIEQRLLIECKRKRNPTAKVPVSIVREALGALDLSPVEADKLVLVSTNRFTRDARQAISRNNVWRISLRDYDDIMQWLGRDPRIGG